MARSSVVQFFRAAVFAVLAAGPLSSHAVPVNLALGADDFGSLTFNGVLVCTYDNISAAGGCNATVDMTPGVWYDIVIQYQNRAGTDGMALSWDQPGVINNGGYGFAGSTGFSLVPKGNLRVQLPSGGFVSGLRGDYNVDGCATQSPVFGEGPINAINNIYNNQVSANNWNGCQFSSIFTETLSGQIQIGPVYNATFENFTAGSALQADSTAVAPDRPNSIDSNLTATVESSATLPPNIPALNTTNFVRLREACGEAPDLSFDRGIALGTGIAHVGLDMLFETNDAYHVYFRNGSGSGIPGPASQSVANIEVLGNTIQFQSLNTNVSRDFTIGSRLRLDTYFDLGKKVWFADVNGNRVVDGAPFINSPLGFVAIGFDFSCAAGATGPTNGAMQFDNFVFEQVASVPNGTGGLGSIATVASGLGRPFGVAVGNGFAYVPDPSTHRVWQINLSNGQKTVVAGTGEQGFNGDGIPAVQAQLDNPSGVAVDASGVLYIADTGNHAVRKVTAPGAAGALITTVAGIPTTFAVGESTDPACATTPTSQCVAATSLRLYGPRGLAIDSANNLYIVDRMNQQVKKLVTSGPLNGFIFVVAGVAGYPGSNDGPAFGPTFCSPNIALCTPAARLNSPVGVAVDTGGFVYIATEGSNNIRLFSPGSGTVLPHVGTFSFGTLKRPTGVAVDTNNNVFIADYGNHVIKEGCGDCNTVIVAGTGVAGSSGADGGLATHMQLNSPMAVALVGTTLYIADMLNGRLLAVNLDTGIIP